MEHTLISERLAKGKALNILPVVYGINFHVTHCSVKKVHQGYNS